MLLSLGCAEEGVIVARRLSAPPPPSSALSSEPEPAYLLFLLDQSGTMGDGVNGDRALKWDPVTGALEAFVAQPPRTLLHASMTLFPPDIFKRREPGAAGLQDTNESICQIETYSVAQVPMAPLPEPNAFTAAIDAVTPPNERGTPTSAALQGCILQAEGLLTEVPGAAVSVVLITDGIPGDCGMIELARAAAERARPRIATHVIVVGTSSPELDALAAAGGTLQAQLVPTGDPELTRRAMLEALHSAARSR
jgi:hypothetical protein